MELLYYAPVVIPTLNRHEHFKRCLESLEQCRWADKTTVYVALDYPPSDKYVEGWKAIDSYLREKEKCHGFQELIVTRRTKNYGIGHVDSNSNVLLRDVLKTHDCYIFTEDDNIFSYRFLEFLNMGLQKTKHDKNIYNICGYLHPIHMGRKFDGNSILLQEMSAWGFARWKDRSLSYSDRFQLIDDMLKDSLLWRHFFVRRPEIYTGLLAMKKGGFFWGDCFNTAYQYYKNLYSLFPVETLVKNCGWDGSGQHGGIAEEYLCQELEAKTTDDYIIKLLSKEDTSLVDKSIQEYWKSYTPFFHVLFDRFSMLLYKITGRIFTSQDLKQL